MQNLAVKTNDEMQATAKRLAQQCHGHCVQDRGVDVYGRPSMTVYDQKGRLIATIKSNQRCTGLIN